MTKWFPCGTIKEMAKLDAAYQFLLVKALFASVAKERRYSLLAWKSAKEEFSQDPPPLYCFQVSQILTNDREEKMAAWRIKKQCASIPENIRQLHFRKKHGT